MNRILPLTLKCVRLQTGMNFIYRVLKDHLFMKSIE